MYDLLKHNIIDKCRAGLKMLCLMLTTLLYRRLDSKHRVNRAAQSFGAIDDE